MTVSKGSGVLQIWSLNNALELEEDKQNICQQYLKTAAQPFQLVVSQHATIFPQLAI